MTKKNLTIIINLLIGIMTFAAWGYMGLGLGRSTALTSVNLSSLKYYTVLSNLLNGTVSLIHAVTLLRGKPVSHCLWLLRLIGTAVVGVTFATVMLFLGPMLGYGSMFQGSNLWLHLILPLLSFISFICLDGGEPLSVKDTRFCMIPTVLYEIGYLGNIMINGIGTWPVSNDFYGFLRMGYGVGAVIALAFPLITRGIALLLNRGRCMLHH